MFILWNLQQNLVIEGGVPDLTHVNPAAFLGDPATYQGCVREMTVNQVSYQLTAEGLSHIRTRLHPVKHSDWFLEQHQELKICFRGLRLYLPVYANFYLLEACF